MQGAQRVQSWTSLSIPHLVAYGEAMQSDPDQQRRSRYIGLFRMPWVPETLLSFNRLALLRGSIYAEHPAAEREEYLAVFSEPGALSAALNWYRAVELRPQDAGVLFEPALRLPVLFVWGSSDPVVGAAALEAQRSYFEGPFRELELDTGHWLMQTRGEVVTAALLDHLAYAKAR